MLKLMLMSLYNEPPFPVPVVPEAIPDKPHRTRECVVCGCKFTYTSRANMSKTCSRSCAVANKRTVAKQAKSRANPPKPPQLKNCLECGKRFETPYTRVVTCSEVCNNDRHARLKRERRHKFATL